MSQFRRRLLMMMQKAQDIWRDVVITGTGLVVANDTTAGQPVKIFPQGWTEQDSYEGNQLFDKTGIVLTSRVLYIPVNVGDGEFTLSTQYDYMGSASSWYRTDVFFLPGNVSTGASSSDNGVTLNKPITVTSENGYVTVALRLNAEGDVNPLDYNIMLNEGSSALPYEPYTGGQPSPNPDYPQEIVSAGNWNEAAQKWEYEIEVSGNDEFSQTVTLTSDRPLTKWDRLTKKDGVWGWEYGSAEVVFDGSEKWSLHPDESVGTVFLTALPNIPFGLQTSLCDKYRNINYAWDANYNGVFGIYSDNAVATAKYFRPPSEAVETVEQWKAWLSENPLTLWYETEAETFIPLSASEQEQMNALHTYYPTTVFSNDQNGFMQIEYRTKYGGDA